MVFIFYLIIILLVLLLAIITARIDINIVKCLINLQNLKHIDKEYKFIIKINIFEKIPIVKISLTQEKLQKIYKISKMKEKIKNFEKDIYTNKDKIDFKIINILKKLSQNIDIKNVNLKIKLGTENAFLTSILVAIISSILPIIIATGNLKRDEINYFIKPVYNNQNLIKFAISGIFKIKVIHIINIIYVLNKKGGVKKYERTSNRRSYDYSYE